MPDIHQSIGSVPPWLELGAVEMVDGVECRAVLGDWSHLPEWDRPPQYVADSLPAEPTPSKWLDGSETREPISQRLPGKDISELKGRHSGTCAIFGNGWSLQLHDLHRIKAAGIPIIGTNRTFKEQPGYTGPETDYLCVVDREWLQVPWVLSHPGLINGCYSKEDRTSVGYRATACNRRKPFSTDLAFDGYYAPKPATTGTLALQVAAYLGFTRMYLLGFDMCGQHFDQTAGSLHFGIALGHVRNTAKAMKELGLEVFVCGSPDSRAPFPKVPFEAIFEC